MLVLDVEVCAGAGAGGGDVERFPGRGVVDEDVGGIYGAAFDACGGGGVAQLDGRCDVAVREPDHALGVLFGPDCEVAVGVNPFESPGVAVLKEPSTEEGWFIWVEGYVGSDVTDVTVHTSSGPDIEASVAGNRFSAWWPTSQPSSDHPAETWSYTVHLADGSTRRTS